MYNNYLNTNRYYNPYYGPYVPNYYQANYVGQQGAQGQPQGAQQPPQVQARPYQAPIQAVKFLTADEMKAYIVMPGTSEMLIDQANKVVMIKSADLMGQSSSKTFNYDEAQPENATAEKNSTPQVDMSAFANKDDLKGFVTKDDLKALVDRLDKMQKQIQINEILKGDNSNGKQDQL